MQHYLRRPRSRRPQLWFTYHLYHKAPDWIGPVVCKALAIPYMVAEASHAPKQSGGPWDRGYRATERTIINADLVISLNENDNGCLLPLLQNPDRLVSLKPFIDTQPFALAADNRAARRQKLAADLGLDADVPWLVVAAMMRGDQKLKSYRVLATALARLGHLPWRLLVVGDGAARDQVGHALAKIADRTVWLGQRPHTDLPTIFAAADLYVWPAIKESFGLAFLEAQAAGLPVVGGKSGGVAGVVEHGQSGFLVAEGDSAAFAEAVAQLLTDQAKRQAMGLLAQKRTLQEHGLEGAIKGLDQAIGAMMKRVQ
ncbi:MAG TPA: glycosyltransferase [Rhodospirillales bacterium]|nr:glycosyltransferase [Rhodospirillales bacterium]